MTQQEIDQQVAHATGETMGLIERLGFSLADLANPTFDPEPRQPLVYDWDSSNVAHWPE